MRKSLDDLIFEQQKSEPSQEEKEGLDALIFDEPSKKKAVSQPPLGGSPQPLQEAQDVSTPSVSEVQSTSAKTPFEQYSPNPNINPIVQGASPFIKEQPLTPKEQYDIEGSAYYDKLKKEISSLETGKTIESFNVAAGTPGTVTSDKRLREKQKELAAIEPFHEFTLAKEAVNKAKIQADNKPREGDDALRPDGTPLSNQKISNIDVELNYIAQKSPAKALELSSQIKQGKASALELSELEAGGLAKRISVQGEELGAMEQEHQAAINSYQETQKQLEQINQLAETQGLTPEQAKAAEEIYAVNQQAKEQITPLLEKIGEYEGLRKEYQEGGATYYARIESEANAKRQAQTDNVYRNKNLFGQLLYNTGNVIEGGATSLLSGVAGLPRTIAPLFTSPEKQFEYDWTESLANSATRMTEKFMLEEPTKLQREAFEDVAKIGDYEVVVKGGKVQSVRDSEGYTVKDPTIVKSVSEQFKAEQPKVEMKGNVGAGTYGAFKALADMGMTLIPVTGLTGRALKGLGMAEGAADFAGIYAGSMLLVNKHAYEAGIEAGLSPQLSSLYANGVAGIEAISESINPMEAQIARRLFGGATRMGAKEFAQTYISGAGLKSSLKKGLGVVTKNSVGEGGEEVLAQKLGNIQDVTYNKLAASNFDTEETLNDYLSAGALGAATGLFMSPLSMNARSQVEKEALALVIQDTPAAIENINKMVGKGVMRPDGKVTPLTQEEAAKITTELQTISDRVKSIKEVSHLDEEKTIVATDLVRRKMALEEKLKGENIDDIAQKKYKDGITKINNQLEILTGLKRGEPYIEVDGEVMDEAEFKKQMQDEQFIQRFEQGSHDVIIENNPELVAEFQEKTEQFYEKGEPQARVVELSPTITPKPIAENKVIYVQKFFEDKPSENLTERQVGSVEKAIVAGIKAGKSGNEIYGILNALGFAPANVGGSAMEINLREYLDNRVAGKDNRTFQETQSPTQDVAGVPDEASKADTRETKPAPAQIDETPQSGSGGVGGNVEVPENLNGIVKKATNKVGNTFYSLKATTKWFSEINKFFKDNYGIDDILYHFQNSKSKPDENGYIKLEDGTRVKRTADSKTGQETIYVQSDKFNPKATEQSLSKPAPAQINEQHKQVVNDIFTRQQELLKDGIKDFTTDEKWTQLKQQQVELENEISKAETPTQDTPTKSDKQQPSKGQAKGSVPTTQEPVRVEDTKDFSEGRKFALDYVLNDLVDVKPLRPKMTAEESAKMKARKKVVVDGKEVKSIRKAAKDISQRVDWQMKNEERHRAIRDIKKGKYNTVSAKMLLDRLEQFHNNGYFDFIAGTGGKTYQVPSVPIEIVKEHLAEVKALKEEVYAEYTPEEVAYFAEQDAIINEMMDAFESDELNEQNIDEQLKLKQDENERAEKEDAENGVGQDVSEQEEAAPEKVLTEKEKAAKELADRIRKKKWGGANVVFDFGLTKTIYNFAVDKVADAVESGTELGKAIQQAVEWIESQMNGKEWDKKGFSDSFSDEGNDGKVPPTEKDEKSERQKRKKILGTRAYEGEISEEEKAYLEEKGLFRGTYSQEERSQQAQEYIDKFGEEAALRAVDTFEVRGALATSILAKLIVGLDIQISQLENTDTEQLDALYKEKALLTVLMEREAYFGGEFTGQLGYEYENSDLKFNVEKQIEEYKAANNGEISPETEAKFRELDREITQLKSQIAEAEEKTKRAEEAAAIKNIEESIDRVNKRGTPAKRRETAKKELKDAWAAFQNSGIIFNPKIENAKTDRVIKALLVVIKEEAIHTVAQLKEFIAKNLGADIKDEDAQFILDKSDEAGIRIPKSLIRDLVARGHNTIESLTQAVKDAISEQYPDATDREIRDAITGYGKVANLNQEEIATQIRKITRLGRLISQMEDIQARKRPMRSGIQRDKLDAEERAKMKEVREAMKDLPVSEADLEQQLKTAHDAIKTRLNNQIEDLQKQLDENFFPEYDKKQTEYDAKEKELQEQIAELKEKVSLEKEKMGLVPSKELPKTPKSAEITRLEKQIENLQKQLDEGVKVEKEKIVKEKTGIAKMLQEQIAELKEISDAVFTKETSEKAVERIEKSIEKIKDKINKNELEAKKKNKPVNSDPLFAATNNRLKIAKDLLSKLRDEAGVTDRKRLELAKKAAERRIADLQRRIREQDFTKKKPTPLLLDTELIRLRAEKMRLQEEYEKEIYKAKIANRNNWEIAKETFWDLVGLGRLFNATLDASFVGVQGGIMASNLAVRNPKMLAEAFANMFRFALSEKKTEDFLRKLKAQDDYYKIKGAKLAITEPHAEITAREEHHFSDIGNMLWNLIGSPLKYKSEAAFNKWAELSPFKIFERAAIGFLDTVRVSKYMDAMQMLERQGKTFENDPQAFKNAADVVNTFTGRASLGFLEQQSKWLSRVFYSPRNWASVFKQTILFPRQITKWRDKETPFKPSVAQKMAVLDLSVNIATTLSMVTLAALYYGNDDDDETGVETDPRSSDFGKIKIGNTRVDPWGGKAQQVVLVSRIITEGLHRMYPSIVKGSYKTSDGDIVPLGTPYKAPTWKGLAGTMVSNKLNPATGLLLDYADTRREEDGELMTAFGQPYIFKDELKETYTPMITQTAKELLKDDPNALNGFLLATAYFGNSVNIYGKKTKKDILEKHEKAKENAKGDTKIKYEIVDKFLKENKAFIDGLEDEDFKDVMKNVKKEASAYANLSTDIRKITKEPDFKDYVEKVKGRPSYSTLTEEEKTIKKLSGADAVEYLFGKYKNEDLSKYPNNVSLDMTKYINNNVITAEERKEVISLIQKYQNNQK